jgi:hypothetical protein
MRISKVYDIMKLRFLFVFASVVLFCSTMMDNSFAVPPMERVSILSETKILDMNGAEIDSILVDQQIVIATPSFTTHVPLSIHYGCGKTVVEGDKIKCVGHVPNMQHVEGDRLVGESRFKQDAVSITQILNEDGVTVHLSWIEGVLATDHVISPKLSWIPEKSGTYSITTFFWESVGNPTALGPPSSIEVKVI